MKRYLVVFCLLFMVSGVAGQQYKVNETSEWEQGSYSSIVVEGNEIFLDSEIPSLDWSQTNFDEPVMEIKETNDVLYAVSGQDAAGHIAKLWKDNGSIIWKVQASGSDNEWNSLDIGPDGYIYAVERHEGIYRLDKSGNFQPGGVFPIDDSNNWNRQFDVEVNSSHLFYTGGNGKVVKFDKNTGNIEFENDYGGFARELEFYNSTYLYQGNAPKVNLIDPVTGNLIASESGFSGSLDAIERGPDDYVWIGDNDGVYRYTTDLNTQLCSKTDYTQEVPGMAADFSGVFTSTAGTDRFNKMEGNCNIVWEESPSPKGYATLESSGRSLYAGAETISGSEDGAIDKYFKEYDSLGTYESQKFSQGSDRYLDEARVNVTMNGENANLTVIWSESAGFAGPQTKEEEYVLSDGLNTLNLPADNFKALKFEATLESVSSTDTPRIHWVEMDYVTSAPGSPPSINTNSPLDGSTVSYNPAELEVNVSDPDGDPINVTFNEKGGTKIKQVNNVPSGDNASASYGPLTPGTTYTWWANITDDIYDVNDSFSFTYKPLSTNNLVTGFETNYTSVMASTSENRIVQYRIRTRSGVRDVNISIDNIASTVDAELLETSGEKNIKVGTEGETVLVRIDPDSTGQKKIVMNVEDLSLGTTKKDNLEVMVRETPPEFQRNSVPGIQLFQLATILFMSSVAYFALL